MNRFVLAAIVAASTSLSNTAALAGETIVFPLTSATAVVDAEFGRIVVASDLADAQANQSAQTAEPEMELVLSSAADLAKDNSVNNIEDELFMFDNGGSPKLAHDDEQSEETVLSERPSRSVGANDLAVNPTPNARVSSSFGPRGSRYHYGIDLAAPTGSPIYAAGAGVVTFAGAMSGYGRMVEIDHGNGYKTRYGHPSRIHVSVGDVVETNQLIANVGCAGRCSGPHLHYEVRKSGKPVNPAPYIAMAKREKAE